MKPLVVKQINVPVYDLPAKASGFRIAHISDLHLRRWGRFQAALQATLANQQFDILAITGDLGTLRAHHERTAKLVSRLLSPIRPPLGIYGVLGNQDHPSLADCDLPITFLRDSLHLINVGGFEFYLAGVEQTEKGQGRIDDAIDQFPDDAPLLVMAHYPSTAYQLPPGAGAIMLSGHTHGGQIRLPRLGCVFTNDGIPASLARGLHSVRGNWLHVTPGIGVSGPIPARLFCPPEISMVTLRRCKRIRPRRRRSHRREFARMGV